MLNPLDDENLPEKRSRSWAPRRQHVGVSHQPGRDFAQTTRDTNYQVYIAGAERTYACIQ
ncbi:MAG: hypothetical protein ACLS37_12780 [Alistipes sp.]